jgi:anaerobic magnesium-protoporphyrin IX monomethyl ester cyclase
MHLTLISPRLAIQKGDFLGSGVPYWPIELATLAAFLKNRGDKVSVVDLFGSNPRNLEDRSDHYLQGVNVCSILNRPEISNSECFILYAISYMSHLELLGIARTLRQTHPQTPIAILENSQAVTAYSIQHMAADFFAAGVDALICGEPYFNWEEIVGTLMSRNLARVPGNMVTGSALNKIVTRQTKKNARYPIPAWELFNLEGYWSIPYSHGPKTGRFLPILTSRGCPYPCDFCVAPETTERGWQGNAAEDVVNEIIALRDRFKVRHFQIEDLNPTVRSRRFVDICRLLIEREARIFFYMVSGTKAETIHIALVPILAQAGCRYISISPESGSAAVMKAIGKRFNYEHGLDLVAECNMYGIRTQACFLVGHPAETEADYQQTRQYLKKLVRKGVDEVAIFIVAPFAGSKLFSRGSLTITDTTAMPSFSPKGRDKFDVYEMRRKALIRLFFLEKLRKKMSLWAQAWRAVFGRPQTKMENLPRRIVFIFWLILKLRLLELVARRQKAAY